MKLAVDSHQSVQEALQRELKREGLELVNLEGEGDMYAWYATNQKNERLMGVLKKVAEGEYEMDFEPVLDEPSDQ